MSQPIQVPLTETSYKANITTTLDDNMFGLWIIGGCAKSPNNTKRNLKQSQMCGAFPHKKERRSSAGSQIPSVRCCFSRKYQRTGRDSSKTWQLLLVFVLHAPVSCVMRRPLAAEHWVEWFVTVQCMTWVKTEEKEKLHVTLDLFEAVAPREAGRVTCVCRRAAPLCARPPSVSEGTFFGGDPLSVMGQGHTMGALCKLCWGCAVVGKGPALISARMFSGVCHVWKVIPSLTFPSHNCLRIRINGRIMKKVDHWITLKAIHG